MSEFVYVYRKDHDDYMHILKEVQVKYPDKFEVITEDEVVVSVEEKKEETPEIEVKKEETSVKVTRTSTKKK